MELRKATRKKVKIKMAISAPTGFGKTYSALLLAFGITGDWNKIAVIDSENESADLYQDLGDYNVISMKPPYDVESFCKAVDACINGGIEVIIVDSTYHYWHGKGGLLEYNNSLGNNSFANWAKTNPVYAKWLDKILQTPAHFICTSRKKQSYEIVENNGKKTVEKKGMEDQIRDGFSYEMTISFNITTAGHLCEVDKDRTRLFADKPEFIITSATGHAIKQWCDSGVDMEAQRATEISTAIASIKAAANVADMTTIKTGLSAYVINDASFVAAAIDRYNELVPPPAPWSLTPDQQKQAQSLVDSSTMDTARKGACALAIATCTTQAGFDAIIAQLQTLQPEGTTAQA